MDLSKFKHSYPGEVKFSDVDSFGVVHNIQYLYWIEWARTQYLFDIGMPKTTDFFSKKFPLMTVHSRIDYFNSARFTDEYNVKTRVAFVKHSSIGFENVVNFKNGQNIAKCEGVLVYVNAETKKVERLPDVLRRLIKQFEGDNCKFLES
ncbi:thioesterase family protein [Candidatus Kapabacteria bacterium]|nr:thioesterase family protein [Candidatus Kapabacteria bacterium]